jgi:PST family polysaccharide transporter
MFQTTGALPKKTPQRSFSNAIKWAYAANWGERAFGAIFTLGLAAILGPRDFGVVAIAMAYILFLQMFLDQGFLAALIQRPNLEAGHLDAVFWTDLALSLLLVSVSLAFGGWWGAENHSPEAGKVIAALSICIPIEGLAAVQGAILKRQMDFKALSIRANVAALAGGAVGIAMALAGFKVWSLVGQQIARDLTSLVLLWKLSAWRPRAKFSLKHLKDLTGFSIWNFTAQLGIFVEAQSSSVLLGFLFGPVAVGLYRIADRLTSSIVSMATTSIQSVSLPEFARLQNRPAELKKSVLNCIRLSSIVTLPGLSILAAASHSVMNVLGPQWAPATNATRLLCILGMCSVWVYFTGPLLQALSRTRQLAALEWARLTLGSLLIVGAGIWAHNSPVERQITAIALARLILFACLVTPVFLGILMRISRISFGDLGSALATSVIGSLAAAGAVLAFHLIGPLRWLSPVVLLAGDALIGIVTGLAVMLAIDSSLRDMVQRSIRSVVGISAVAPESGIEEPSTFARTSGPATAAASLVSIVIPTYNRAYTLGDALASALGQSYGNLEILLVDDGSTDNTREIVEAMDDGRIRYIRHDRNRGCSAAYNTGIAAAKGQLIAILDSDDVWRSDYLERHLRFLDTHPEVDVSFCDTEIVTVAPSLTALMHVFPGLLAKHPGAVEHSFSRRDMHLCLLEEIPVKPSAAVIRREALNRVGVPFAESWPSGTDWDLFLRLSRFSCFGYIHEVMATQRRSGDATHRKYLQQDKLFLLTVLRREQALARSDRAAVAAVNRGIAGLYNSLAWYYLQSGHPRKALTCYLTGFAETWHPMLAKKFAAGVLRTIVDGVATLGRRRLRVRLDSGVGKTPASTPSGVPTVDSSG